MDEPEDLIPPVTCEYDDGEGYCGALAEAACFFHVEPLALMLCRNHSHVMGNHKIACPDCLAGLGGVE